ncbi:Rho GTPase-activating protein 29 [Echinococcus granulosus]|uniref:Rho GTPase-activating protein 29 n=1 Tax=Echinococcus granulosus TaxID=6210 RepID=W6UJX1_ECHGR|nr:Rho GTPase-activating protein 29 [Echinococcus granulosus]EUB61835.1 Rho GTPase-activating protein 29 [Echinococcus granulosus]
MTDLLLVISNGKVDHEIDLDLDIVVNFRGSEICWGSVKREREKERVTMHTNCCVNLSSIGPIPLLPSIATALLELSPMDKPSASGVTSLPDVNVEMELMYAYRESVDAANARLVELEKSRVEIICDTRLTVTKCDEVVSDSMAELISHLFVTRTKMLSNYEDVATKFQNYIPGQPYHRLLQEHVQSGTDVVLEKYQFEGYHDNPANAKDRGDASFGKFVSRFAQLYSKDTSEVADAVLASANPVEFILVSSRAVNKAAADGLSNTSLLLSKTQQKAPTPHRSRHSESDSEGEGEGVTQGSTTVLSSLVQFGSTLFRPDLKKTNLRGSKGARVSSVTAAAASTDLDPAHLAALEAAAETEYDNACYVLIQCINGIETQENGLQTHGIYRVPASKIKVAGVVEAIRAAQESGHSSVDLSGEYAITLASTLKTRLIQLPEPLLSYNLYDQFVDVGKALEAPDSGTIDEQAKRLHNLIGQLSSANQRVAGLLFHHLKRVSNYQSVNQMGAANLATMFGPTVLRRKPKFNVANMMEFIDNTWLMKAVELCINRAADVFGPSSEFTAAKLLKMICNRAVESKSVELLPAGPLERDTSLTPASFSSPPITAPTSAAISTAAAREAFFTSMKGEAAPTTQNFAENARKISVSKSEQTSPFSHDQKSAGSRTSEDFGKALPQYQSSTTLQPHKDFPPSNRSQESLQESSSGSIGGSTGSGLKRLISAKAQNLHQRLQNITSGCVESSTRAGRVFSPRKLLHSTSLRNSPKEAARKSADPTPQLSKESGSGKMLDVADYSYIDTDLSS